MKTLATEICRKTVSFEKMIYQLQKDLERVKALAEILEA